jgi:hypothetical protein
LADDSKTIQKTVVFGVASDPEPHDLVILQNPKARYPSVTRTE